MTATALFINVIFATHFTGTGMPSYRLYHFKRGHIERAENLAAEDDLQAVAQARQLVDGRMVEVWQGPRRIHTFNPH
jgi:hypothetical protein